MRPNVRISAISAHVPVWDKTERQDGTFASSDFQWNEDTDKYRCPAGLALRQQWRPFKNPRTHITKADSIIYRARERDCSVCPMKAGCCPNVPCRRIVRSRHEAARALARRIATTRNTDDHAASARRLRCSLPTSSTLLGACA
jgi:hypothetical protein